MEEGEGISDLNLKGIWIPIEILTDNKLSDKEKIYKCYKIITEKLQLYYIVGKPI